MSDNFMFNKQDLQNNLQRTRDLLIKMIHEKRFDSFQSYFNTYNSSSFHLFPEFIGDIYREAINAPERFFLDVLIYNKIIQSSDSNNIFPLFHALTNVERLEILLQGKKSDIFNNQGETLLVKSIKDKNEEAIKTLLENQADPNLKDRDGVTPLMWAAWTEEIPAAIVKLLIESNIGLNLRLTCQGRTALMKFNSEKFQFLKQGDTVLEGLVNKSIQQGHISDRDLTVIGLLIRPSVEKHHHMICRELPADILYRLGLPFPISEAGKDESFNKAKSLRNGLMSAAYLNDKDLFDSYSKDNDLETLRSYPSLVADVIGGIVKSGNFKSFLKRLRRKKISLDHADSRGCFPSWVIGALPLPAEASQSAPNELPIPSRPSSTPAKRLPIPFRFPNFKL